MPPSRYRFSLETAEPPTRGNCATRAHRAEIDTQEQFDEDTLYIIPAPVPAWCVSRSTRQRRQTDR